MPLHPKVLRLGTQSAYEDRILQLIDNQDNWTRSDIQSLVTVIVLQLAKEGYDIGYRDAIDKVAGG